MQNFNLKEVLIFVFVTGSHLETLLHFKGILRGFTFNSGSLEFLQGIINYSPY